MTRHTAARPLVDPVRYRLTIEGMVQGIGFRPWLYRQAQGLGLNGYVRNTPGGVVLEIEGHPEQVDTFITRLNNPPPAGAHIHHIDIMAIACQARIGFSIVESERDGRETAAFPPDIGCCPACLAEVADPGNRRHAYPFTHCTACGPRYSLAAALPWDRERTSMMTFTMCDRCLAEYHDPNDRRFHAETNCCPDCGPVLTLRDSQGDALASADAALTGTIARLRAGEIVAIKGPGGYQLLVRADDPAAIQRLRLRKRRPAKPFALLLANIDAVEAVCENSAAERALLTGPERPIVLLRRRTTTASIAMEVAPENPYLGIMLPAMPLQTLLASGTGVPLIATSGNVSEEPIVISEPEVYTRLAGIADAFLTHDRSILTPVDDSVVRHLQGRTQILRRARGYAPLPIATRLPVDGLVGGGAYLKSTIALGRTDGVHLSQHLGDLGSAEARDLYDNTLARLQSQGCTPVYATDLHPDYHSTRVLILRAQNEHVPLIRVPHHLAHVAAVMAEHDLAPPLLGIAWDGTGLGEDGALLGGEFIQIDENSTQRLAWLRPFPLPGGEAAIREPRRAALGLLHAMYGPTLTTRHTLAPLHAFRSSECRTLINMVDHDINSPLASSGGRLFDAIAALLDLSHIATYEGEAACRLEWLAEQTDTGRPYEFVLDQDTTPWTLDWAPLVAAVLADIDTGIPTGQIALGVHEAMVRAMIQVADQSGLDKVALGGGCFQNALLSRLAITAFSQAGYRVYWPEQVPPGDGGISLGQVAWAARLRQGGIL